MNEWMDGWMDDWIRMIIASLLLYYIQQNQHVHTSIRVQAHLLLRDVSPACTMTLTP